MYKNISVNHEQLVCFVLSFRQVLVLIGPGMLVCHCQAFNILIMFINISLIFQ